MRRILGLGVEVSGTRASWLGTAALITAISAAGIAAFACGPTKTDAPPETPSADAPAASEAAPTASATEAAPEGAGGAAGATAEAPAAETAAPPAETAPPAAEPAPEPAKDTKKPKSGGSKPAPKADAPAAEAPPAEAPKGDFKPCVSTSFASGSVKSACASGGLPAAKNAMKAIMNKANAKEGATQMKCVSCHSDTSKFGLKANAVADLRAIL